MKRFIILICYIHAILFADTTISVDSLFSIGNRYFSIEKYDESPASLLPPTMANWTIGTIKKVTKKIVTGKAKTKSFG